MRRASLIVAVLAVASLVPVSAPAAWPAPAAPVIDTADGYVAIPGVAVPPDAKRTYRAIYDGTHAADAPNQLLPVLNMAGSELNAFGVAGVPLKNVQFVIVFHGGAMDGLLDDAHYKTKFGVPNPNLKVLAQMKKAGVKLYVCGQNVAFANVDPKSLSPDITIASDALIVLMQYQNDGYALLSF